MTDIIIFSGIIILWGLLLGEYLSGCWLYPKYFSLRELSYLYPIALFSIVSTAQIF